MSVDSVLRQGLREAQPDWTQETATAFEAVTTRARKQDLRRNLVIGAAAAAVVTVTLGALSLSPESPASQQPTAPTPSESPRASSSFQPLVTSGVRGLWQTRALKDAEVRDLLDRAGLSTDAAQWEDQKPPGKTRLSIYAKGNGFWSIWLGTHARPDTWVLDNGSFWQVGDDQLVINGLGSTGARATLGWTRTKNQLRLSLVSTNWPDHEGVTGADQVRALYATLPFVWIADPGD